MDCIYGGNGPIILIIIVSGIGLSHWETGQSWLRLYIYYTNLCELVTAQYGFYLWSTMSYTCGLTGNIPSNSHHEDKFSLILNNVSCVPFKNIYRYKNI